MKTALAPKRATFSEMVLIFDFRRDEASDVFYLKSSFGLLACPHTSYVVNYSNFRYQIAWKN